MDKPATLGKGPNTQVECSANQRYLIRTNDRKGLYVAHGAKAPHFCQETNESIVHPDTNITYRLFKPQQLFLRDCLHTAEEILHQAPLKLGKDRSKVAGTEEVFGISDDENIRLARDYAGDIQAAPTVGQAYVIVAPQTGKYPYHAAAVVAQDGQDQVTLEIFGTNKDAQQNDRTYDGEFYMYTIGDPNTSFHARWHTRRDLFGQGARTLVIERR